MKKELFDKVISYLQERYGGSPTISTFEDSILYSFKIQDGNLKRAKALIESNKLLGVSKLSAIDLYERHIVFKRDVAFSYSEMDPVSNYPIDTYITLRYNYIKDNISCSLFTTGYKVADRKNMFFPFKRNVNVFCYSKHLYHFHMINKIRQVRILKGTSNFDWFCVKEIVNILLKCHPKANFDNLNVTFKHFIGTKDALEVVEKQLGIKVPKSLRRFPCKDIEKLYKVIDDHGSINKICQAISKYTQEAPSKIFGTKLTVTEVVNSRDLWFYLALSMGINDEHYLVRDWFNDFHVLGEKTTINITSETRMREEHLRNSRRIRLLHIEAIKTNDVYRGILENFPYTNVELVDSKERLLEEGIEQDHCVVSYADKINEGNCAIFSFVAEDNKRYTMEVIRRWTQRLIDTTAQFKKDPNDFSRSYETRESVEIFYIAQIQSKRNNGCPDHVKELVKTHIDLLNEKPLNTKPNTIDTKEKYITVGENNLVF